MSVEGQHAHLAQVALDEVPLELVDSAGGVGLNALLEYQSVGRGAHDDLTLLAGARAAHGPGQLGAELPGLGATRLGRDIGTCSFAIDILTNLFLLATLE